VLFFEGLVDKALALALDLALRNQLLFVLFFVGLVDKALDLALRLRPASGS
jgi:hypothetical protein